jgi:hypothetical protein
MYKFPSIEALRHVVRHIRDTASYHQEKLPTLYFEGTVKLHGTSAGVARKLDGQLYPQSRERELSYTSDNAGFAAFVLNKSDIFQALFAKHFPLDKEVVIYGEWCGEGIQKKMGINQLPKHFVIFGVLIVDETNSDGGVWLRGSEIETVHDNEHGIWNIRQIPVFSITIDFNFPDDAVNTLTALTLEVENVCPWALFRGVTEGSTLGEGIVWYSVDTYRGHHYLFKTKGLKHKNEDKEHKKIEISAEKAENIHTLVLQVLPEWRLEQGIAYLKENNIALIHENTGEYLKWINMDVRKEEEDVILASGLEWKALSGSISRHARDYYFREIEQ